MGKAKETPTLSRREPTNEAGSRKLPYLYPRLPWPLPPLASASLAKKFLLSSRFSSSLPPRMLSTSQPKLPSQRRTHGKVSIGGGGFSDRSGCGLVWFNRFLFLGGGFLPSLFFCSFARASFFFFNPLSLLFSVSDERIDLGISPPPAGSWFWVDPRRCNAVVVGLIGERWILVLGFLEGVGGSIALDSCVWLEWRSSWLLVA